MSMTRRGFLWGVAALLGIALTAALTWSVSRLAGQRIGLAAEPVSIVQALAPARQRQARPEPRAHTRTHRRAITLPATTVTTVAPVASRSTPTPAAPVRVSPTPSSAGGNDRHDDNGASGSRRRDD